jgi:hypothetical protein
LNTEESPAGREAMPDGRKVRVRVRTVNSTYEGNLLVPPMRRRVSDVLNDDDRTFINLTDVRIDGGQEIIPFVSLNKHMIEAIIE